ncbi:MAG: NAD(P)/FAD-dependent oxidoreductase [Bythopirellula sp.]|nr:NAD(P)/FAD-dependent oxidoreductase [Bythopirellula sp.]
MTDHSAVAELPRRIVIVGGGFAGLQVAMGLKRAPVQITLVDRRNFHLFQPLLYQVATGGLSPANIAAPLRSILAGQRNCQILMGEVTRIDLANRRLQVADRELSYDVLVVAAGATHSYFGHPEWEQLAPGLKTIEDATEIRRRVFTAFEAAERTNNHDERHRLLNFVIVGAGPTGVELAGALAEIARHSLKEDFHDINPAEANVVLIEAGERVLAAYPPELSIKAEEALHKLGVSVRTGNAVEKIAPDGVTLKTATGIEFLATNTVLWAAGVQASPLAKLLSESSGAELDRAGRIKVQADLSLPGQPGVFVLGDMAHCVGADGKPLPGVAAVAISQGKFIAKLIKARIAGRQPPTYRYRDLGSLATIGRSAAVADIGNLHFSGFLAWLMWLFIHLLKIVSFRNRVLVFFQWGWSYFTYDRAARLITGNAVSDYLDPPLAVGEKSPERSGTSTAAK